MSFTKSFAKFSHKIHFFLPIILVVIQYSIFAVSYTRWEDYNLRHDFIAENLDGKIVYVDPQSGIVGSEVENFFKSVKMNKTELMRIDNLKLNNEYLNKTCEVWNLE